jgi:hypothetical protein
MPINLSGKWVGEFTVTHLANKRRVVEMTPRRWKLLAAIQSREASKSKAKL